MVLAALVGIPLGSVAGIAAGSYLFRGKFPPKDFYSDLDLSADALDDGSSPAVEGKAGTPVTVSEKALLQDLSPWLTQPDYDRPGRWLLLLLLLFALMVWLETAAGSVLKVPVALPPMALFINSILTILWPKLGPAVYKEAVKQSKQPIEDVKAKVKVLESVTIDEIDLGTRPFRLDSVRTLKTYEDELILEAPLFWGGDISVRVTATLRLGGFALVIPVHVANVQFKALTRITVKPLVETLPCAGGVTLSLMEEPHVDCEVRVGPSPDLMALPGVPQAVQLAIKMVVSKMLVYPNELAVPVMPNFGAPPPPLGMLHVKVISATGLRSTFWDTVDPFVTMEVREGRPKKTQVKDDQPNPVWNEEFDFVVDDTDKQRLNIVVKDYDLLSSDLVATAIVSFKDADFIKRPRRPVQLDIALQGPAKKDKKKGGKGEEEEGAAAEGAAAGEATTAAALATGVVPAATAAAAEAAAGGSPAESPAAYSGTRSGSGGDSAAASPRGSASAEVPSPHHSGHSSFLGGLFKKKKKKGAAGEGPSGLGSPSSLGPEAGTPTATAAKSSGVSGRLGGLANKIKGSLVPSSGAGGCKRDRKGARGLGRLANSKSSSVQRGSACPGSDGGGSSRRAPQDHGRLQLELTFLPSPNSVVDYQGHHQQQPPLPSYPAGAPQDHGRLQLEDHGRLQLELTFLPFRDAEPEGLVPPTKSSEGPAPAPTPDNPAELAQAAGRHKLVRKLTSVRPKTKGVLTVNLKKCTGLEEGASSYVLVSLDDAESQERHQFQSPVVVGECSPRFEFKNDFVNVSAKSVVRCEVYTMPASVTGRVSRLLMVKEKPALVGYVRVEVGEVAKEGRIKDVFALQEAEAGEMYLTLEWNAIEFNEDSLEEENDV
ncbi:hypothetical protein N2152v2_000402 [Parachlorella kessleri]